MLSARISQFYLELSDAILVQAVVKKQYSTITQNLKYFRTVWEWLCCVGHMALGLLLLYTIVLWWIALTLISNLSNTYSLNFISRFKMWYLYLHAQITGWCLPAQILLFFSLCYVL